MRFEKKVLADLPKVYAVSPLRLDGADCLLAATEERGRCLLFRPPDWQASVVWEGPGGTMNVLPVPGRRAILGIQEFFPVFDSQSAGIVWAEPDGDPTRPWRVLRRLDLPFVHRIATLQLGSEVYLVAATLCGGKTFRDDWSRPGQVYVGRLPDNPAGQWEMRCVVGGMHKNHGMHLMDWRGRKTILIAGQEGLLALDAPPSPGADWNSELLIDHEISDIYAADLDGDGEPEIAAIEPFHGNLLVIYKRIDGCWRPILEHGLSFGHALWGGELYGKRVLIIGNRSAGKELAILEIEPGSVFRLRPRILDVGVGPAQVAVVGRPGAEAILSANHASGQVTLYTPA